MEEDTVPVQESNRPNIPKSKSNGGFNKFRELGIVAPSPPSDDTPLGEVTLCELYGELITLKGARSDDQNLKKYKAADGVAYPNLFVPKVNEPERINILRSDDSPQQFQLSNMTSYLSWGSPSRLLQQSLRYLWNITHAPLTMAPVDPPIRALAWHPHRQLFAIGIPNDAIFLYDLDIEAWSPIQLRSQSQRGITCLQWRPSHGNVLAVGCRTGVAVWTLTTETRSGKMAGMSSEGREFDVTSLQFFPFSSATTSIAWSPCGRFLARCGEASSTLTIIDISLGCITEISKALFVLTLLRWSPTGNYLFVGTEGNFRVFETTTWTSLGFSSKSPIDAAWNHDGRLLVVVPMGTSDIVCFAFTGNSGEISPRYLFTQSLSPYTNGGLKMGGKIQSIRWDPSGERLVASFAKFQGDSDESSVELVALFGVQHFPKLEFIPRGFIRGPAQGKQVTSMEFRGNFERGALLTVCWLNGKISFVPMYFKRTLRY
eukprot:TRINITY_DN3810_c1_g1_i1.p1 TRINITY_DN3810_c1_g1~~TRINITY_DN3810_c1_g1_i1.p1  ORF type:complete len:487 (+),score=111.01 TRINITY_DN3810_c1_g1_i1:11-1471(+)